MSLAARGGNQSSPIRLLNEASEQGGAVGMRDFVPQIAEPHRLKGNGIAISMDGKGKWHENVFVERIWKSINYEEIYLHVYALSAKPDARSIAASIFITPDARTPV